MCDDNCENLKQERIRCEGCRTINLALHRKVKKTDMQVLSKCTPAEVCVQLQRTPINPTCFKVMTPHDYRVKVGVSKPPPPPPLPYIGHGKLMYGVKTGILLGAVYFTYAQGVWGDQVQVTECAKRWQEFIKSFHTRRPPKYDHCGRIVRKETIGSVVAPAYEIYKGFVTSCFSGVAKLPMMVKCMYIDYLDALEKKEIEMKKAKK